MFLLDVHHGSTSQNIFFTVTILLKNSLDCCLIFKILNLQSNFEIFAITLTSDLRVVMLKKEIGPRGPLLPPHFHLPITEFWLRECVISFSIVIYKLLRVTKQ